MKYNREVFIVVLREVEDRGQIVIEIHGNPEITPADPLSHTLALMVEGIVSAVQLAGAKISTVKDLGGKIGLALGEEEEIIIPEGPPGAVE